MRYTMLAGAIGLALFTRPAAAQTHSEVPHWVGSWASAQQVPEPNNMLPDSVVTDATIRQIVHLSAGGTQIRVRISNVFGTQSLIVDGVHAALSAAPNSAKTVDGSDRTARFDGETSVTIPAGASYWSDPIALSVRPLTSVTVTMHLPDPPARQTGHPGSRATSYIQSGNHLAASDLPNAKAVDHWYQLSGVAVAASAHARAIVTLGDSITDGHGSTLNGNDRWPDRLAERLQANPKTRNVSVLNLGIGGNRVLNDGLGPNALSRFDRDVLGQPGVRYLIVLEGINDLGVLTRDHPVSKADHLVLTNRIIGAFRQIVTRARAQGIKVIGGTIMPDAKSGYYHPGPLNETDRATINRWIRTPGNFDVVVDFDKITRNPAAPTNLRTDVDSGDGLHPGPKGYAIMADAIPLDVFQ